MKNLTLKKKIVLLVFAVSCLCPVIAGIIIYRNNQTVSDYNLIAERSLPRTRAMGAVLGDFRELRVQVRSLAIRGNTAKDMDKYLKDIGVTITELEKKKDELVSMMSLNDEERLMSSKVEASWKKFKELGGVILELQKKGDEESMNKLADLVRNSCPVVAAEFDNAVREMIEWQSKKAVWRTDNAKQSASTTSLISILLAIFGVVAGISGGGLFAASLARNLNQNMRSLSESAEAIFKRSSDVALISTNLSEAATQQASSLQETVASIDEISAMVARNSDSALASSRTSENSTLAAKKGKEKVGMMMDSINAIASGNNEIIDQMQKSNKEISEIVNVIQNIAQKTQVINDIVFQTKLLSFNASVEAARAGEHGKGFAVVAEEVGNLASMSGKAATEITDMLTDSVKRVTDIVDGTKSLMDSLIRQSKEKVSQGTNVAKDCSAALDEILHNVSSVNEMIREISTASQEQSSGIREVNKAMSELDHVTQQNSSAASNSSQTATELNDQVDRLNKIVAELASIVDGSVIKVSERKATASVKNNVVSLKPHVKPVPQAEPVLKKAAGSEYEAPSNNDPRFEDV